MLVCRESSEAVKKQYSKAFGTEASAPTTLFNFESDTLFLDWGYFLGDGVPRISFNEYERSDDIKQVRNLAVWNGPITGPLFSDLEVEVAEVLR